MRKRYFSFIALIMVFGILFSAAGCGVRINGKDYEFFKVNEKDKNNIFSGIGSESSGNQEVSEDKQNGEQLNVSSNAGNIKIESSNNSKIVVKADKKVRGASAEEKKNIMDNMNVVIERNGKLINIAVKTKDGNDFWKWQNTNFKTFQVTLNYEISLPEGINQIKSSIGAGNIEITGAASEFMLDTGAGNIEVKGASAKGSNSIKTGAGNIDFEGKIDGIDSFDASTGVGNIAFKVPENTKMSLKADTGVGILSGSFVKEKGNNKFHFSGDINGGGPSVKLDTGVGNVQADKN